jgi:HAE1 family hydrophobic/amphiphilic exporter-1
MKIVEVSTRRRVTVAMFTIAVLLFGLVAQSRLKINLLPDLSYPTLTIRTEYTGAAPAEMENLITKPIEEVVGVVKNVQTVRSVSRSGQSDVTLEFAWGTSMDFASLDVREKLDALVLPLEAKRPLILRFDPSLDPIMRFSLARANVPDSTKEASPRDPVEDLKLLRRYADEQLKKQLESTPGVAAVKISGGFEDEIQIQVDQGKLDQLNLPIETVISKLRSENVNLSGGRLEEGVQQFLVRTVNQFATVEQMRDVIIESKNGRVVHLRDIALISEGFKEREAVTRINGVEAIDIAIYKEGDANTVSVAENVKQRLEMVKRNLPKDVELTQIYDQSVFISQAVDEVVSSAWLGGLLAILVIYFFLKDVWSTIVISLSIPLSVIATFGLMHGFSISLNIMSLGGIALGIGMLVDNAIVVLENIARYKEQGMPALKAAVRGASEVGTAVVASTLTTVAVFFPLVFVEGVAGQLFRDQALTVTFSLIASLIVALTIIPMLATYGNRKLNDVVSEEIPSPASAAEGVNRAVFTVAPAATLRVFRFVFGGFAWVLHKLFWPFQWIFDRVMELSQRLYESIIKAALSNRFIVLGVAIGAFAGALLLVPMLGVELIPQLAQGELKLEVKLAPGTPLAKTDAVIDQVQRAASAIPLIDKSFAVAGSGNKMDANPDEGGENYGEVAIYLKKGSKKAQEEEVIAALRTELERIPGVQYKFSRPVLFSFATPVEVEVTGYDLADIKRVSDQIVAQMEKNNRFADVKSTMQTGQPEVQILFDRERAAALGLDVNDIANRVVNGVRGAVATRFSWRERKVDVLVRAREEDRNSVEQIGRLIINPQSDRPVTLASVAEIRVEMGPGEIRRNRQERVAVISANLVYGDLQTAANELKGIFAGLAYPPGVGVLLGGQNAEMAQSFASLQFALALAVFLVYLVMASQFESLVHPFIILFTIPLALIGAILALLFTGSTISIIVFIGVIMLAGIVVNNAIVLIDMVNQLRAGGMEKREALLTAGASRLRPILMTTLTTVLGLLPLALGLGEGAELRAPMAITVIGGLTVSTLLTLVVIPVIYDLVDRKKFEAPETV